MQLWHKAVTEQQVPQVPIMPSKLITHRGVVCPPQQIGSVAVPPIAAAPVPMPQYEPAAPKHGKFFGQLLEMTLWMKETLPPEKIADAMTCWENEKPKVYLLVKQNKGKEKMMQWWQYFKKIVQVVYKELSMEAFLPVPTTKIYDVSHASITFFCKVVYKQRLRHTRWRAYYKWWEAMHCLPQAILDFKVGLSTLLKLFHGDKQYNIDELQALFNGAMGFWPSMRSLYMALELLVAKNRVQFKHNLYSLDPG